MSRRRHPRRSTVDAANLAAALETVRVRDAAEAAMIGRIGRFKGDRLRRAGADLAACGALPGTGPEFRARMQYARMPQAMSTDWHRGYPELGLRLDGSAQPRGQGVDGARRDLPPRAFQLAFEEQRAVIRTARVEAPATTVRLAGLHSAFAVRTLMLLYFASGHRRWARCRFSLDFETLHFGLHGGTVLYHEM